MKSLVGQLLEKAGSEGHCLALAKEEEEQPERSRGGGMEGSQEQRGSSGLREEEPTQTK